MAWGVFVALPDAQLDDYRQSIGNIDAALIFLLAERFKVTQAVGQYKATAGLPPADPAREGAQIARLRALAQSARQNEDRVDAAHLGVDGNRHRSGGGGVVERPAGAERAGEPDGGDQRVPH